MTGAPGKLYHFTGARFWPGIKAQGLTLGAIPLSLNPPRVVRGWQWLTQESGWNQSWCENQISIAYRRDDLRLTIRIPKPARGLLRRWNDVRGLTPLAESLSAFGDPDNWWLFRGRIPPSWVRAVDWRDLAVAT